jgi:hypothetical protein
VFTLGCLPRNSDVIAELHRVTDLVLEACANSPKSAFTASSPPFPHENLQAVRASQVVGRFVIRWDTRTVRIIPIDPLRDDAEPARLELARRSFRW